MPDSTRSGLWSFSRWLIASMTQSVGVPSTEKWRSSYFLRRSGRWMVSEWLAPDCSISGATTQTSSVMLRAIFSSTLIPVEWMLSSFEIRIRAPARSRGGLSIGSQNLQPAHVGAQLFRNHHVAVRQLLVLQHRHQGTADRETRAVQRMDEFGRTLAATRTGARLHPAGLEIAAVGAARNLAIGLLPRQPDLDVIGLARTETHIAGAQHHGAERQVEPGQHRLGRGSHALMLGVGLVGGHDRHQLDLPEL